MIFYVNYFALKSKYIQGLADKYNNNLIVDNTQAFFEKPLVFLYPCVYPIVIAIIISLEFLFKKVNKLSIIFNYVQIFFWFIF